MQRCDAKPDQASMQTVQVGLDGTQEWKEKAEEVPIISPPPHVM